MIGRRNCSARRARQRSVLDGWVHAMALENFTVMTSPQHRIDEFTRSGWWSDTQLHQMLARQAAANPAMLAVADPPNRPALTGEDPSRLTYAELEQLTLHLSIQLREAGLVRGDTVLLQLPNTVELVALYFAASRLGLILSPVPMQYRQHELKVAQKTLGPQAMITLEQFHETEQAAQARDCLDPDVQVLAFGASLPEGCGMLCANVANHSPTPEQLASLKAGDDLGSANDVLTVCWTSGTTGEPKGVPRSHNMWLATARNSSAAGEYQPGDRLLNPFPLVNMAGIGGFLFPFVDIGCSLYLHHPFDPGVFLQQMAEEKITFTIVPPAVLNQLAGSPETWNAFDFTELRRIGSGSAPLAPWMVDTFDNTYGKQIVNFYGSNEGIALFSTPETSPDPKVRATMFPRMGVGGMPWTGITHEMVGTRVVAVDTEVDITEPGEPGELLFFGPTVFDGYTNNLGDDVFTSDGWFRTGDLVEICPEATDYYRIVGRCKDIINRGGMKISPAELDILLEAFPGIREGAVCSYPDENLGERVCACIVPQELQHVPTLEKICAFLTQQGLARFKLPERLLLLDVLPRNPMGKVQRNLLEQAVAADE